MILIILMVFIYVPFLLSYEHTSCTLLDLMTDEGRPTMKLSIHSETFCCFLLTTMLVTG